MSAELVTIITAAIGSTGVIGLLTALITRNRVSRTRRYVEEAESIKKSLDPSSIAYQVVQQSIESASIRMASNEINRFSPSVRVLMWLIGLAVSLAFSYAVVEATVELLSTGAAGDRVFLQLSRFALFLAFIGLMVVVGVFFAQSIRDEGWLNLVAKSRLTLINETVKARRRRVARLQRQRQERRRTLAAFRRDSRTLARLRDERDILQARVRFPPSRIVRARWAVVRRHRVIVYRSPILRWGRWNRVAVLDFASTALVAPTPQEPFWILTFRGTTKSIEFRLSQRQLDRVKATSGRVF